MENVNPRRAKGSKPGQIHLRIVEVMRRFPEGISGGGIRQELEKQGLKAEDQTHLDRRKRDLKKWYTIRKKSTPVEVDGKKRRVVLYQYVGERQQITDEGHISLKLRAEVIQGARGRCQMCGRTVAVDGARLVVDHKKPRDWGGTNDRDNLWAICDECNSGKKAYFSSLDVDADAMKQALEHKSVHVRIGEMLKAMGVGARVPSAVIEVVADQDDWQKRLRELRYPVIGWRIDTKLYKDQAGRKRCDYILRSYRRWPPDPSGTVKRFEEERKKHNRGIAD
jgi:HNH endonuclease